MTSQHTELPFDKSSIASSSSQTVFSLALLSVFVMHAVFTRAHLQYANKHTPGTTVAENGCWTISWAQKQQQHTHTHTPARKHRIKGNQPTLYKISPEPEDIKLGGNYEI